MRCPARVAYADVAFDRVAMDFFLKVDEFANASAHIYLFAGIRSTTGFASVRAGAGGEGIRNDGNASRVIASVFKTLQAVQQDFFCLVISYVADYSAHKYDGFVKSPSAALSLRLLRSTYFKSMPRLKPCSALHLKLFTLP